MRIIFMGTPDFAQESLKSIYEAGFEVVAAVTNPDKPKGRGMQMIASPVKEYCNQVGIPVLQPLKIRNNQEFINEIKALKPDVIVVVAYGKILPLEFLEIPPMGCINVHGSLLPQYRGAAPIQWSVLNGDKTTGITTMYMDEGMDTGDMILQQEVEIGPDETTGELWNRLEVLGGRLIVETLHQIENGSVQRTKQPEGATYAPMLTKEMSLIDWNKSAKDIHNLVRGLNPIMGAYTLYNDKKIKIWKTQIVSIDELQDIQIKDSWTNGEIASVKPDLLVYTGKDLIQLIEVQPENSKRMSAKDFINGSQIQVGDFFK